MLPPCPYQLPHSATRSIPAHYESTPTPNALPEAANAPSGDPGLVTSTVAAPEMPLSSSQCAADRDHALKPYPYAPTMHVNTRKRHPCSHSASTLTPRLTCFSSSFSLRSTSRGDSDSVSAFTLTTRCVRCLRAPAASKRQDLSCFTRNMQPNSAMVACWAHLGMQRHCCCQESL